MSKQEKKGLLPARRFPEFRHKAEWKVKTFNELFTIGNGRDYKHLASGDVPVYGSGGYMLLVNDYLYDGESVCIGRKGTIDNPIFLTGKFWTVDTLFYTHSFRDCLPKFIYAIFQQINWANHNEAGGIPSLSKSNIQKIKVAVPKPDEQQKIADCLTTIDELITAQTQRLDALETHKKGLMQQLFPTKDETVPKRRFPEFRDKGAWEKKTLGEICDMQAGKFLRATDINEANKGSTYPCYGGNGLRGFTKTFTHNGKHSLIGRQGALCGNVMLATGQFHATEHAVVVTPNEGISTDWLFYKLKYLNLNQFATGQAQPGLSIDNLKKVELKISPDKDEQQKIADCLTSADKLISAQTQKLEALKNHKKGLMQELFPAMDEVAA
ncbi:restriction endonuclease subunit S [Pseudomonas sessilinigenes]|uniref:Restriction endonuclease subunit S n=1 Tax=Pseudomonas sessilinigenes TaxID=658629 RepID=A0ABX8MYG4_9PSED|nr:restriction endonuclease subunit S [Pseudomonas sessilinigenes]AZC24243.1 Type I restriction-modification system, specificity subunit S [Pseudomonas sessilinigenes]QXH43196.1 restriction endonuclease subunit S [Pseudomonas sessilinigenes]